MIIQTLPMWFKLLLLRHEWINFLFCNAVWTGLLFSTLLITICFIWENVFFTDSKKKKKKNHSNCFCRGRSCFLYVPPIFWWREKHTNNKVWNKWRQVGQRDPEELGIPACTVTRTRKRSSQRVLHAPGHLGDIRTAQDSHGETLSFHICCGGKGDSLDRHSIQMRSIMLLPLTVVKICGSIWVFDVFREASPQPPQVPFDQIQLSHSCLEETWLDDTHFDTKVLHVPPGQRMQILRPRKRHSIFPLKVVLYDVYLQVCYFFKIPEYSRCK